MRAWLVLACLLALGCGQREQRSAHDGGEPPSLRQWAPTAAQWLARVAQAHEAADRAVDRGDRPAARKELLAVLEAPAQPALQRGDREAVLADLYGRLSGLAADEGGASEALTWADRGLALGRQQDVLTINLLLFRSRAHRRLGHLPEARADLEAARRIQRQYGGG